MKINKKEITKKEVITEYVAVDGTTFQDKEMCECYERSALCAVKKTLKKLNVKDVSQWDLFGTGFDEAMVEIYDVKSAEDLLHLRMYCDLESNGSGNINNLDKVTVGHDVVLFWNTEKDWYWTRGNGSIESVINSIKEQFKYAMSLPEDDPTENNHTSN
jgi:hypothetical protein